MFVYLWESQFVLITVSSSIYSAVTRKKGSDGALLLK